MTGSGSEAKIDLNFDFERDLDPEEFVEETKPLTPDNQDIIMNDVIIIIIIQ